MTAVIVILVAIAAIIAIEGLAALICAKKAPLGRKLNLEFLLYGRVQPFTEATQEDSQASAPRYSEHPFTGWSLNPDFLNIHGELIHNRQGFRDDIDFEQMDSNSFRVYCAGDSTTYGTNIESTEKTWPYLLEKYLNESDKGDRQVRVINGGVGGYFTFQSFVRLSAYIDYLHPDVVLVYHCKNDLTPFYNGYPKGGKVLPDFSNSMRSLNFQGMSNFIPPFAKWSSIGKLWAIWKMTTRDTNLSYTHGPVKPSDLELMLATKTDFSIIESMQKNMVALCQARGIPIVYMTQRVIDPIYDVYVDQVNDLIRGLDNPDNKCFVLDLEQDMPTDPELFADKLHLTEAGCDAAAQQMADSIVSLGLTANTLTAPRV